MARFRAVSHVEFQGRRVRARAGFSVTVSVAEEPPPEARAPRRRTTASGWVPTGLQDPTVRWDVLPPRIRPEEWTTGQADDAVPGSITFAEVERRPEGYGPVG